MSAIALLSTHLHPEGGRGRGGSFRRRKSRSRSPSVMMQQRSASPAPAHQEDGEHAIATVTTTTTTLTTTSTSVTGAITSTTSVVGMTGPSLGMPDDELRSPVKGEGAFAETVSDLVDIVKFETSRKGRARCKSTRPMAALYFTDEYPLLLHSQTTTRRVAKCGNAACSDSEWKQSQEYLSVPSTLERPSTGRCRPE